MICSKCGFESSTEAGFCERCGSSVTNPNQMINNGKITIKRIKTIFAFAMSFKVEVDNQLVGQLVNGGELVSNVPFGTHHVKVSLLGSKIEEEVTIKDNQNTVVLLIKPKFGLLAARPFLVSKTYNIR